jgi:hypothetical protein
VSIHISLITAIYSNIYREYFFPGWSFTTGFGTDTPLSVTYISHAFTGPKHSICSVAESGFISSTGIGLEFSVLYPVDFHIFVNIIVTGRYVLTLV